MAVKKKTPFNELPDEEVAYRLVKLYFEEIARLGFKRKLDLDAIINAYFYSLARVKRQDSELKTIKKFVLREEQELATESKEEMIPSIREKTPVKEKEKPSIFGTEYKGQ